jgi:hypothetical protein
VTFSFDGGEGDLAASVLAPKAKVILDHVGIRGGVYAGSIMDDHGQVNYVQTPWSTLDAYEANHQPGDSNACRDESATSLLSPSLLSWIGSWFSATTGN